MRNLALPLTVLLWLVTPALAQDVNPNVVTPNGAQRGAANPGGGQGRLLRRFEAANTTHDGHLTLAQARAAPMPRVVKNFGAIDADHKGFVTVQDIRSFVLAHRGQGKGPGVTQTQ